MYGCQQVLIKDNPEITAFLEFICSEANKLSNCAIYYCRQMYFKAGKYLNKFPLDKELKSHPHFKALRANTAQQTLHSFRESFNSFKALNRLYKQRGELHFQPQLPKYLILVV